MKRQKSPPKARRAIYHLHWSGESLNEAVDALCKEFRFSNVSHGTLPAGAMVSLLAEFALSQIDVIFPRLVAMIRYCDAEQLDQHDYMHGLIKAKFAAKLHKPKGARRA